MGISAVNAFSVTDLEKVTIATSNKENTMRNYLKLIALSPLMISVAFTPVPNKAQV